MVYGISRRSRSDTNRRATRKAERDNCLVGGLQRLVDRVSKPTFSGDPLVRLKQSIEAAEKDSKSTGKDKMSKSSNEKSESSSGGSCGSRGANAVEKTTAGKDEQDDWKPVEKAGKSFADVVKKREKQKPEGLHASHWKGTVVDLADFISRVSTTKTGDHIIAGVSAGEPLQLGGLLVPAGISAALIALPWTKTAHPSQEL